jgi:hypothetical protein
LVFPSPSCVITDFGVSDAAFSTISTSEAAKVSCELFIQIPQMKLTWMDPLHFSLELILSPPAYLPIFPSSLIILFTGILVMIIFSNDKGFGLADIGQSLMGR